MKRNVRALGAQVIRRLPPALAYRARMLAENVVYRLTPDVHALPPIFHYWSNRWLRPRFEGLGFASPEDFFRQQTLAAATRTPGRRLRLLGIGCGSAQLEQSVARFLRDQGHAAPEIALVDVNAHLLKQAVSRFRADGFERVTAQAQDLNRWKPAARFDLVIANQCLHHIVALEWLMDGIAAALEPGGRLLVSDVIGRNGHRLWPEARAALLSFWDRLPPGKRFDRTRGRIEGEFVDHDHSMAAFEGIRCQDILKLLIERFDFGVFAPHSCLVIPIVERRFGWNFSVDDPEDRRFIDALDAADQHGLSAGTLKPTQLVAELGAKGTLDLAPIAPWARPGDCIRHPEP